MQGWISKGARALLVGCVLLGVPGLTAQASARSTVDLLADYNIRIDGAAAYDYTGVSVAGAGDVNGDGRDDVIVGAYNASNNSRSESGSAYVIYGRGLADPRTGPIDLADTNGAAAGSGVDGADGFRIDGAAASDYAGYSVAGAGDVNGDGRDDVIVGAYRASNNSRAYSGSAYVIYGRGLADPRTGPINLADTNGAGAGSGVDGADGFRIDGAAANDQTGHSVAGAGDVNGDGRDDVIVGAYNARNNSRSGSGSAYVIYGRELADPRTGPIDLADTNGAAAGSGVDGADGFRIDGAAAFDSAGVSVAGAGDVNGDGRDDVIVGAYRASNNSRAYSGSAYVIYGRGLADPRTGPIDLADTNGAAAGSGVDGADGFRIDGAAVSNFAGLSVAGAGDVNGDGRDDVIVGAPYAGNNFRSESGSAYVIYGRGLADPRTGPIDLADTNGAAAGGGVDGADGFRIDGAAGYDQAGYSVAGAGDVNGDGRDDVIVGAHLADNNSRSGSGSGYVIYGRGLADPRTGPIDLADTNGAGAGTGVDGADGFRIDGAAANDQTGHSVAGAGDVNGDGRDDVIVGAYLADNNSRSGSGSAYVIHGAAEDSPPSAVGDTQTVGEDAPATAIDVLANDTNPDGGEMKIGSVVQPVHGTVAITNDGADLTYQPQADYCNDPGVEPADEFTYELNGGSEATVAVTVQCSDDAPVAVGDSQTVAEDSPATAIDVLANDTNPDGGEMQVESVVQPVHGTVAVTGDGAGLTYEPEADYCNDPGVEPADDFTYTLNGGSEATVAVTVECFDDAPVAVGDTQTVGEDSPATAIDVLANDTNPDGGEMKVESVVQPVHGTVAVTGDGAGLTYEPEADYCNDPGVEPADDFTYTLNGGSEATVAVTVQCFDDAPGAVGDTQTVDEDSPATAIDVLANDTNPDGGEMKVESVVQPGHGTVAVTGAGAGLTYEPDGDYCNDPGVEPADEFSYELNDGSEATVAVTVECFDDAPVAVGDTQTVGEDSPATAIDVLANDTNADGGEMKVVSVVQPAHGTVVITGDGAGLTYEPEADYCNDPGGEPADEFSYELNGGSEAVVAVAVPCVVYVDDVSVLEGGPGASTPVSTVLRLAEAHSAPVSVRYQPVQSSASGGGVDYSARSGSVTFAPGETEKVVGPFTVRGDSVKEGAESFQVKVNAVGGDQFGTVQIEDDDGRLFATVSDLWLWEEDSGSTDAEFKVRLSEVPAAGQTVSLAYATADGTAGAPGDYTARSGTLTFTAATGAEQTVRVPVHGDTDVESDETLKLKLSAPQGLHISDADATATLVDVDDGFGAVPVPSVYSDDAGVLEGGPGASTLVSTRLRLSAPHFDPVTVSYSSQQNGASGGGVDFTGRSGAVTFAPGETEKLAGPFIVKGDAVKEGSENFQVKITSVATHNATIGEQTGNVFILDEEGPIFARITNASGLEGNTASSDLGFRVSLSDTPATGQQVTVKYASANATASSPSDYSAQTGTLTFTATGAPEQTITVPVNGDTNTEPNETLKLKLNTSKNLTISDTEALGTIFNDDR